MCHNEDPRVWSDVHMNRTVTWRFLFDACDLIYLFICKGRCAVTMLNYIIRSHKKFSHPEFVRLRCHCLCHYCPWRTFGREQWTLARQKWIAFPICSLPTSGWQEWNISPLLRNRRVTSFENHFSETFPCKRANNRRVARSIWRRVVLLTAYWYVTHLPLDTDLRYTTRVTLLRDINC